MPGLVDRKPSNIMDAFLVACPAAQVNKCLPCSSMIFSALEKLKPTGRYSGNQFSSGLVNPA